MAAQRAAGRREQVVRVGAAMTENGRAGAPARAGAWSHLDWEEALDELDRIRHESVPPPPIDLDNLFEE